MDGNWPLSYKAPTLLQIKGRSRRPATCFNTMDKEFLRQIDQASELIPDQQSLEKLDDETLICECFCVNVGDIRRTCADEQLVDLELLSAQFNMGLGCQSCFKKKDYWINRIY